MYRNYSPTIHNVLALWRFARGDHPEATRVRMDWCTLYTREETRRFLLSCLEHRLLFHNPICASYFIETKELGRKWHDEYQRELRRDAERLYAIRHNYRACQWGRRLVTREIIARFGQPAFSDCGWCGLQLEKPDNDHRHERAFCDVRCAALYYGY